jgi:capsular exopolysaccharide synthesis family protein
MNKVYKALQQAQHDRGNLVVPPRLAPATALPTRVVTEAPVAHPFRLPLAAPDVAKPTVSVPRGIEVHLVSLLDPQCFAAEQYRTLRHIVEQSHRVDKLSVLAVSAPSSGDGKTTTAINLAGALAQAPDARVLLIDADIRRPSIARYLGLSADARGLVNAIRDERLTIADVVQPWPTSNLSVVTAGPPTTSPYELLKSPRLGQLFEEARQEYDYVVVDTPPLIPASDCRIIDQHVDGFLVVVAAHKTRAKAFDEAIRTLEGSRVFGVVLNGSDSSEEGSDYYQSYAAAGSRATGSPRPVRGRLQALRHWWTSR